MFVVTSVYAQKTPYLEYNEKPSFLLSKYNACNKNLRLKMQSCANFMIAGVPQDIGGKTDSATFEVRVDPDSVYDCSYKIYSAQFADCCIEYITYGLADKFSVLLDGKQYSLSCLDGGMDVHIKYLSHQYMRTGAREKLSVKITEDLPLTAEDKSVLLLKKGSFFSFDENVTVDSAWGSQTRGQLNALSEQNEQRLCEAILRERKRFYQDIIHKNPSQNVFSNGWNNRMEHLKDSLSY